MDRIRLKILEVDIVCQSWATTFEDRFSRSRKIELSVSTILAEIKFKFNKWPSTVMSTRKICSTFAGSDYCRNRWNIFHFFLHPCCDVRLYLIVQPWCATRPWSSSNISHDSNLNFVASWDLPCLFVHACLKSCIKVYQCNHHVIRSLTASNLRVVIIATSSWKHRQPCI